MTKKPLIRYPWYAYVQDRPAQRQRCSECGYSHQGREVLCAGCREKVEVARCEADAQEDEEGEVTPPAPGRVPPACG